jgi:hypothetical protein
MMGNEMTYLDPFFKNQQNWANSYLANQGIDPKSNPAAYYNYMNQNVYQPQGQTVAGAAAQFQPQAFSEAATMYGMPASLASSLLGTAAPILAGPTTAAAATPFSGQQPVNYGALATAAQQQAVQEYQAKLAQYQQNLGGIYGLAGTGLALAAAPFTGGASLMALPAMSGRALGGLFSSAPSSGGFSNVGDVTYAP